MTASQLFDIYAPQLADDSNKTAFIEQARLETSSCQYGSLYEKAVALLAAHEMTLTNSRGSSGGGLAEPGSITGKKEGDLSLSFGNTGGNNKDGSTYLNMTMYGQQLIALTRKKILSMGVTGGAMQGLCND